MKERQERIDCNNVNDIDNDRHNMAELLKKCSNAELIVIRDHYENLVDHRILKLESSLWLILIYKEISQRDRSSSLISK